MTYSLLTPNAMDTALPDAVRAVAAMIGQVLAPYGVAQSVPLAADGIDVSPDSGVFVEHTAFQGTVEPSSECADDVLVTLHSNYYVRPLSADRQDAADAVLGLLVPAIRAHRKHIEHAVDGLNVRCRVTSFAAGTLTRGTGDTAQAYVGLRVVCELYLFILEPSE